MNDLSRLFFLTLLAGQSFSCAKPPQSARQEILGGVRGIGISHSPLAAQIKEESAKTPDEDGVNLADDTEAGTVAVTVYAAIPRGEVATVEVVSEVGDLVLTEKDLTIDANGLSYEDYGNVRLLSAKLTAQVPPASMFKSRDGSGFVSYKLKVSTESESEMITGGFRAYPAGATELSWPNPEMTINSPTDSGTLGSGVNTLSATYTQPVEQDFGQVSWFVSSGEVYDRNSASTTWRIDEAGVQALIATVRFARSGGFALKVVKVNIR